ncbi:MAG: YrhB family protein [Verrucomicrobiales bacterium]|jgi:hypothetical protein|nr:YrhB family protein [Verrucomicrobiales bacterium]
MLTIKEARYLVSGRLRAISPSENPFILDDSKVIEKAFGWVFFYNSQKFMETRNDICRLAGNGPIIINKFTHDILILGTDKPANVLIEEYEGQQNY